MDRRWEQRRAAANARWAEVTSSVVIERADVSGIQPTGLAEPTNANMLPPADLLMEDMRQLELTDQSKSSAAYATSLHGVTGPFWLRDTQRAMLLVAALSCSILLALLYFGGFLG